MQPLLLVAIAACCVLGRLEAMLQAMLALALHEAAHAVAAASFEQRIDSIELQPFGCVARMRAERLTPHAELFIAIAGPAASLVIAGAVSAAAGMLPKTAFRLDAFLRFNLTLALVNLLPALPLDGGRAVRALLIPRIGETRAQRITAWSGVCLAALMLAAVAALAAFEIANLSLLLMGVFLMIASILELKRMPGSRVEEVLKRGSALDAGGAIPVSQFAVRPGMRAKEALRLMQYNRFHVLRVVDAHNRTLGELDEAQIVCGTARGGTAVTLGEILSFDQTRGFC